MINSSFILSLGPYIYLLHTEITKITKAPFNLFDQHFRFHWRQFCNGGL